MSTAEKIDSNVEVGEDNAVINVNEHRIKTLAGIMQVLSRNSDTHHWELNIQTENNILSWLNWVPLDEKNFKASILWLPNDKLYVKEVDRLLEIIDRIWKTWEAKITISKKI